MIKYDVSVAYLLLCVKGWETGLVSLAKLNIDKDGITLLIESCSISTSFSSYITSIIPKYVDRCTIKILWGQG